MSIPSGRWAHYCRPYRSGWLMFAGARQSGQALAEALVMFSAMLLLWAAVAWLGRFQDMALQASHASRFAAFSAARGAPSSVDAVQWSYFDGPGHGWTDRRGKLLLAPERSEIQLQVAQGPVLDAGAQVAQHAPNAQPLREQWKVADSGIVDARVSVRFFATSAQSRHGLGRFMTGLRDFDVPYPTLARHTAILADAGHAPDDAAAQDRVAGASLAWADIAQQSYGLASQISTAMSFVDKGWQRPAPGPEWLNAWAGDIPKRHQHLSGGLP